MLLESINKTYHNHNEDIQALNNINLYIQKKGMIFIVGQSGCGKTSLLHIISGKDNENRKNNQFYFGLFYKRRYKRIVPRYT